MPWYVLYTKPNYELKVYNALREKNMEAYCPTHTEIRQWSDRKKKVTSPLFKSYVFVHLLEKERPRVFEVHGVVRYLFYLNKPAVVRDEEILILKNWINGESVKHLDVEKLEVGEKVTFNHGILKNKNAVVQELGKNRVRLVLPNLGYIVNARVRDIIS